MANLDASYLARNGLDEKYGKLLDTVGNAVAAEIKELPKPITDNFRLEQIVSTARYTPIHYYYKTAGKIREERGLDAVYEYNYSGKEAIAVKTYRSRNGKLLEHIDEITDEKQIEKLKGLVGDDKAKFVYSMLEEFSKYFHNAPFSLRETNVEKVFGFDDGIYDDLESTLDEDIKWQKESSPSVIASLPWVGQKYLNHYEKKRKELIEGLRRRNHAISIRRLDVGCREMQMKILSDPNAKDSDIEAAMFMLSSRAALMEDGPF